MTTNEVPLRRKSISWAADLSGVWFIRSGTFRTFLQVFRLAAGALVSYQGYGRAAMRGACCITPKNWTEFAIMLRKELAEKERIRLAKAVKG